METNNQVKCPRCGSVSLTAQKQGYGLGNALLGGMLFGDVGLLGGFVGSSAIKITCLSCGKVFSPGDESFESIQEKNRIKREMNPTIEEIYIKAKKEQRLQEQRAREQIENQKRLDEIAFIEWVQREKHKADCKVDVSSFIDTFIME